MTRALDLNDHLRTCNCGTRSEHARGTPVDVAIGSDKAPVRIDPRDVDAAVAALLERAGRVAAASGRLRMSTRTSGKRAFVIAAAASANVEPCLADLMADSGVPAAAALGVRLEGHQLRFHQGADGRILALSLPLMLSLRSSPTPFVTAVRAPRRAPKLRPGGNALIQFPSADRTSMTNSPQGQKPDIVPSAPPETPAPAAPVEAPQPDDPTIIPDQPGIDLPEPAQPELPALP